jgi:hypothetical protein
MNHCDRLTFKTFFFGLFFSLQIDNKKGHTYRGNEIDA